MVGGNLAEWWYLSTFFGRKKTDSFPSRRHILGLNDLVLKEEPIELMGNVTRVLPGTMF
jgi:hypothetical protein